MLYRGFYRVLWGYIGLYRGFYRVIWGYKGFRGLNSFKEARGLKQGSIIGGIPGVQPIGSCLSHA